MSGVWKTPPFLLLCVRRKLGFHEITVTKEAEAVFNSGRKQGSGGLIKGVHCKRLDVVMSLFSVSYPLLYSGSI